MSQDEEPRPTKTTKKTVTRTLLCKFSDKELIQTGKDLEANLGKIDAKEEEKKAVVDAIKADIAILEGITTKLREILRDGGEEREVECEETTDYRQGQVRVKRLDTGEMFQKRDITQAEKQLPMEAQEPAGKLLAMDGGKGKPAPLKAKLGDVAAAHGGDEGVDPPEGLAF